MQILAPKMGLSGRHEACRATGSTQECCLLVSRHDGNKQFGWFPKKHGFLATKTGFCCRKISIFLCYTYVAPLFWAHTDPIQWDHHFPILWGTLDAFGFPVDAHSAGWRAVLWPNCQKWPYLGPKNAVYSALNAVIWGTTKHAVVKIHP